MKPALLPSKWYFDRALPKKDGAEKNVLEIVHNASS